MVGLRAEVDEDPPEEVGEGVRAEDDGVGEVGQHVDQEVLQRVAVVRGQGDRGGPLRDNSVTRDTSVTHDT